MNSKLLLLFALATITTFGDTTWDFGASTCVTELPCTDGAATSGTTQHFMPDGTAGPVITVTGSGVDATKLFLKNDGGDENGVGLAAEVDQELLAGTTDEITVDMTAAVLAGYTNFRVSIGSIQTNEEGLVTTLLGTTAFTSAMDDVLTSITLGADNKFEVTGIFTSSKDLHSDVLLDSIEATPPASKVPEPGSIVLLGTGLLAAMSLLRRRTQNQQ